MQMRKKNKAGHRPIFFRLAVLVIPLVMLLFFSQTAFAQNTYVITDGDRVMVYTSAATDPAAVLTEAGLTLGADDTYTTQSGSGISEITVQRSQMVSVYYGGEVQKLNSTHSTVGELLTFLGIPTEGVQVSASLDSNVTDGMQITVNRVVNQTETYTTEIPYKTLYCQDASLPVGSESVLVEGRAGQQKNVASVRYVDSVEVSRSLISQNVVTQPVDRIVAVGTGEEVQTPPGGVIIGDGIITLPSGEVLTFYDTMQVDASAYTHTDAGCDFITATGTTVRIGTVAVDPRVIPYGTRMFIIANDGSYVYGIATAEDCGGSIKNDRVDLYYPTYGECIQFGRRDCTVYFLG